MEAWLVTLYQCAERVVCHEDMEGSYLRLSQTSPHWSFLLTGFDLYFLQ